MRFAAVASLALCGLASAKELSIKQRQVQTIVDVLNNVNGLVGNLDGAIAAWNNGSPQPVIDASGKVIDATAKGTEQINAAVAINVNDALQVQRIVTTLTQSVTKAVNDLVSKKDQAKAAQLGGEAYKQLKLQLDGAKTLSTAISQKVPTQLTQVAVNMSQNILNAIQKGIDAYEDVKGQVYPGQISGGAAAGGAAAGASASSAPTSHAPSATGASTPAATASSAPKSGAATFKSSGSLGVVAAVLAVFAL